MDRALRQAERGIGLTSPNPVVGAVLVKDERVVGEGAHLRAGGPHAEAAALEAAGPAARGATCYVTLEPCAHFGRTPPCGTRWCERVSLGSWPPSATPTGRSTGAGWRGSGRPASR
jgi:diaminohydroxyphosphoribosylaminopyrimidine deaminase/5-amino-6-(5-phosphoribosylamino)uracil reductase